MNKFQKYLFIIHQYSMYNQNLIHLSDVVSGIVNHVKS